MVYLTIIGRNSSVGIVACYGLNGPGIVSQLRARFSTHVQTGPGFHTTSCARRTRSRGMGPGVDHPPPYSAEVTGRVELYL